MDSVLISDRKNTIEGLDYMVAEAIGPHGYVYGVVELPIALLIIEIAKVAEDTAEFFPIGKWATIQSIEGEIKKVTDTFFKERGAKCKK